MWSAKLNIDNATNVRDHPVRQPVNTLINSTTNMLEFNPFGAIAVRPRNKSSSHLSHELRLLPVIPTIQHPDRLLLSTKSCRQLPDYPIMRIYIVLATVISVLTSSTLALPRSRSTIIIIDGAEIHMSGEDNDMPLHANLTPNPAHDILRERNEGSRRK
jgi:hypothetical protein